MRDGFSPNERLTTNILMVFSTFLIAFNLSKISTVNRDQQIANKSEIQKSIV